MEFKRIFQNCPYIEKTSEGYCLRRFTDKQIAHYKLFGEGVYLRAINNAGITMSFYTDAESISFDFKIKAYSRERVVFDVYEDDVFTKTYRWEECHDEDTILYQRTKQEKSKITIYLPYMCDAVISNLHLGDYTPVDKSGCKKYLALGDSITQGMLSELTSITYTSILEREWDAQLLNHGVGGYVYNADSLDENLAFDPDIVTVAYGTNDYTRIESINTIEENVHAYYKKLKAIYPDKEIYIITPIWRGNLDSEEAIQKMRQIRKVITRKAEEYGFAVINGTKLVPHVYEAYIDKGLHPNAFGFEEMAKNIMKAIKEADYR